MLQLGRQGAEAGAVGGEVAEEVGFEAGAGADGLGFGKGGCWCRR